MKIRTDFVTNSSSSSFILFLPHKPKSTKTLTTMLFGAGAKIDSDYDITPKYIVEQSYKMGSEVPVQADILIDRMENAIEIDGEEFINYDEEDDDIREDNARKKLDEWVNEFIQATTARGKAKGYDIKYMGYMTVDTDDCGRDMDEWVAENLEVPYVALLGIDNPGWWTSGISFPSSAVNVKKERKSVVDYNQGFLKYDDAWSFSEGRGMVKLGGKRGYIDISGSEVIPCQFDDAWSFDKGLTMVKKDKKWGYINLTGCEISPCQYDNVERFADSRALVKKTEKWGYIDLTGFEVISCQYEGAKQFVEGRALVKKGGKWGYIDTLGNEIIPCQYHEAANFSEGRAMVRKGGWFDKERWCYIDMDGREISHCYYYEAMDFSEGRAMVKRDEKWGYIDADGNEIIPCQYTDANSYVDGLAIVRKDGKWGCINANGYEVIPYRYDNVKNFSEGLARVSRGGKWGYVDNTGCEVITCQYDVSGDFYKGLAKVRKDKAWGYIDTSGKEIISCAYEDAGNFSEGMAKVKKGGRWGFINTSGTEVIPCQCDDAQDFSQGIASVKVQGKYGFFDLNGNSVIPCRYDEVKGFSEGLVPAKQGNKWGYIKAGGMTMNPHQQGREIEQNNQEKVEHTDDQLPLFNVVITGALSGTRASIISKWEKHGAAIEESVTAKTDYLVTNEKPCTSSKGKAAEKRGVPIVSEEEFERILAERKQLKSQIQTEHEAGQKKQNETAIQTMAAVEPDGSKTIPEDQKTTPEPVKDKSERKPVTVVITGALSDTRANIVARWSQYGVTVKESVSAQTDYLVTNEQPCTSSKAKAAAKHGIPIVTELQFMQILLERKD